MLGLNVKLAQIATDTSSDAITSIKTVHSFNREEFFEKKYYKIIREAIGLLPELLTEEVLYLGLNSHPNI
jgi:hypothetical protein